jgi:hypothetical protein
VLGLGLSTLFGDLPLFFGSYGPGVAAIGVVKAVCPGVWGILQAGRWEFWSPLVPSSE